MEVDEIWAILGKGCPWCGGKFHFTQDRNVQEKPPTCTAELHMRRMEPTGGIRERFHCACGYEKVICDDRVPSRKLTVFDHLDFLHERAGQ